MEIQRIEKLINEWDKATDKVIEFENPGYEKVRALFKETFELLNKYGKDKLVPKEISSLLLEMNKFGWWVSDLEETPLHDLYQEIVSLIFDLNKCFLTCDCDFETIKDTIERIVG